MSWRRFHFVDSKSKKFWSIMLDDNSHTVRYGRIGTNGQTKTKEFAADEKAKDAYEKLVADKVKKGYVEVSAIRDIVEGPCGVEAIVYGELFGVDVPVRFDEGADAGYAQKCADYLNALSNDVVVSMALNLWRTRSI